MDWDFQLPVLVIIKSPSELVPEIKTRIHKLCLLRYKTVLMFFSVALVYVVMISEECDYKYKLPICNVLICIRL